MPNMQAISIIIPAAGIGRRMKSYGVKALIEIKQKETIIHRQLRLLKRDFPNSDITVVVGYEAERIIKALPPWVKVVENEYYEETNVSRSIGMGLRVANHPHILIVNGDLVFNKIPYNWPKNLSSFILIDTKKQIGDNEIGVTIAGGSVIHFSFGLPIKWAQIAYLTGRELEIFKKIVWSSEYKRKFTFEALNSVLDQGGIFRAIEPLDMKIIEVDSSEDIKYANSL